jgi:hypothetical protein
MTRLNNVGWLTNNEKHLLKLETEILKVHLARLFKESQRPAFENLNYKGFPEVVSELPRLDRTIVHPNDTFEDELKLAGITMAKSMHNSNTETIFDYKVKEEVNQLINRMKIYGI